MRTVLRLAYTTKMMPVRSNIATNMPIATMHPLVLRKGKSSKMTTFIKLCCFTSNIAE